MSFIKKSTQNKIFKIFVIVIIPTALFSVWICASLLLINPYGFFSLVDNSQKSTEITTPGERLLKGQVITGRFQSDENNLGVLILNIDSKIMYNFEGDDSLVFRLKEKDLQDWIATNTYTTSLLRTTQELPIGIPQLNDSKNKTYIFEIESQNGNIKNALFVSPETVKVSRVYRFSSDEVLSSKKTLATFMFKKISSQFTNVDYLLKSFIFLLPLLIYLLLLAFIYKFRPPRKLLVILPLGIVAIDILFLDQQFIGITIFTILLWGICIHQNKFNYKATFIVFISLIGIWLLIMTTNISHIDKKLNIWTYIFLVIGTGQIVLSETKVHQRIYSQIKKYSKSRK